MVVNRTCWQIGTVAASFTMHLFLHYLRKLLLCFSGADGQPEATTHQASRFLFRSKGLVNILIGTLLFIVSNHVCRHTLLIVSTNSPVMYESANVPATPTPMATADWPGIHPGHHLPADWRVHRAGDSKSIEVYAGQYSTINTRSDEQAIRNGRALLP